MKSQPTKELITNPEEKGLPREKLGDLSIKYCLLKRKLTMIPMLLELGTYLLQLQVKHPTPSWISEIICSSKKDQSLQAPIITIQLRESQTKKV